MSLLSTPAPVPTLPSTLSNLHTKPQPPPTCAQTKLATSIRQVMVFAMLTIAFHMLMFFWHQPKGTIGKLYGLLPAALVVALLVLLPVASLMNMYYTQNAFTKQVGVRVCDSCEEQV